jgi:hypothetical protein
MIIYDCKLVNMLYVFVALYQIGKKKNITVIQKSLIIISSQHHEFCSIY